MDKILAAGGLVMNQLNELLMVCRRSKWDLPKGHLDKGETLEECAIREVKEETGLIDLTVIDFVGTTEHEYYDSYLERDAIKQVHWFKMRGNRTDVLHPQIAESIEWVRWIPQGELKNYLNNSYSNIREIIVRAGLL